MINKQTRTAENVSHKTRRGAKLVAEPTPVSGTASAVIPVDEAAATPPPSPAAAQASIPTSPRPKESSKLGIVLALLEEADGASLAKLVEVTGWLPHTTRAALTGLRKRGFPVVLQASIDGSGSVYRIRTDAA